MHLCSVSAACPGLNPVHSSKVMSKSQHVLHGTNVTPFGNQSCIGVLIIALFCRWKPLQHTWHLQCCSNHFITGAVTTLVSRCLLLLRKERWCFGATSWSNNYINITSKMQKEQLVSHITKERSVLGQHCGLTQGSVLQHHLLRGSRTQNLSTCSWPSFLFKSRQLHRGKLLPGSINSDWQILSLKG